MTYFIPHTLFLKKFKILATNNIIHPIFGHTIRPQFSKWPPGNEIHILIEFLLS